MKPMLLGARRAYTPHELRIVAAWIIKTDFMLAVAKPPKGYHANEDDADACLGCSHLRRRLVALMETGAPPENSSVRVAAKGNSGLSSGLPFLPWLKPRYPFTATGALGYLIWETVIGGTYNVAAHIASVEADRRFLVIWPPNVAQSDWPPPVPLARLDPLRLRSEWGQPPHQTFFPNIPSLPAPALPHPDSI